MAIEEIKNVIKSEKYLFLNNNDHLRNGLILLGLGGSYAYGTETETSDIDLRGCALNSRENILGGTIFEQFEDKETDTVIYAFNKFVRLVTDCNPNMIETLGLKPEHYLYLSPVGKEMLDNKKIFLSKKCIHTFGGYASSQLRRLDNKSGRIADQAVQERHILNSILRDMENFSETYTELPGDAIKMYLDTSVNKDFDNEIFMDINLNHYPVRDYKDMLSRISNIMSNYNSIGKRNKQALIHAKIAKHSMHLLRLYMMYIDILEKGEIITFREKEHDLLMDIRNGKYIDEGGQPVQEFFELVEEYENRMNYAANNTDLPEEPDFDMIKEFLISVNDRVVKGKI